VKRAKAKGLVSRPRGGLRHLSGPQDRRVRRVLRHRPRPGGHPPL